MLVESCFPFFSPGRGERKAHEFSLGPELCQNTGDEGLCRGRRGAEAILHHQQHGADGRHTAADLRQDPQLACPLLEAVYSLLADPGLNPSQHLGRYSPPKEV